MRNLLNIGHADTNRTEAFSDGVLAIVITLLVLDVKVPQHVSGGDAALWQALTERLPAIGAWIVSFLFVLVFWVAHHYLFENLAKIDRGMLWLNGLFLLTISFTPFPTALVAEYPLSVPAVFTLSVAMFLTACSFTAMRWYASFYARLMKADAGDHILKSAMARSLLSPGLYGLAVVASLIWPVVALIIQVIVPILFFSTRYGRTQGPCYANQ